MKALLLFADGRTKELDDVPYAQWLEHDGAYFYGAEAFTKEKPYDGAIVYLQRSKEAYDSRRSERCRSCIRRLLGELQ